MPTIEEMFDIAEQSAAPSSLDAMFDVAEQEEEKKTAADVQRFGVEQPMRAISAIESALPVGLSVQNRLQRKEALQEEAGLARAEGAAGGVGLKAIELAQRTLEPLTPSGLMNQPARLIGRPDVYQAGQPLIQLPRPELRKGSAAAGMANLALGAVESMTTPEMIVTAPGLAASALARGAMAFDMARHIPEQVAQSAETLATPESTAQEKVEAIGAPLMSAFFAGALARGHVAKPKEIPLQTGKALEVPEGARTPRIEPPPGIQRATPAEAELAAKRMQRTATAAYEAPKPQKATVPEGPIEEIAPPAPETPQAPREIATWEDAVYAIRERAKGTETKEQIQALLPEIKLSREAAGNLALDAFGENWKPGGQVRAPGPKPVEGLTPEQQAILAKGRTTTMSAEERALAERMMSGELERPSEAPQAPVAERISESIEVQRKGQEEGRKEIAPIEPAPVEQPAPAPAPSPTPEAPAVPEPVQPKPITASMESAREVLQMTPKQFAARAKSFNKTNLELGQKVTDAELAELEAMAAKANERWQQAKERAQTEKSPEAMDEMMALSSMPQYFNEAIAEAKRVRERKPDVAQGEGRLPSGEPPNREELRNVPEQGKGPGQAETNIQVQEKVTPKEPLLDWYETVKGERESLPITLQRRLNAFESYARTLRSGLLPGGKKARGRELVLTREGAQHYKDLFEKEYASWKAKQGKQAPAAPPAETIAPKPETIQPKVETAKPVTPPVTEPEQAQGAAATAATAALQPSPVPALTRDIKPISQIIRDIAKGLNVPIRFGRLRHPKYGGYYEPIANAIRVRQPNKVPIVSHEAGHRLDRLWEFSKDKAIASELDILGDNTTPGSMSSWTKSKNQAYKYGEGMAEFVRYWLTDPAQAKTAAPNTFVKFEQVLEANKDFGAVLRQAQTDIKTWKDAPQLARLRSHISTSNPNGARYGFSELVRDVADDLQFAKLFVGDAMKAGPVKASQNIYQLMRAYRGNYGMSDTWITKGTVDFRTREVTPGKSYKDALEPVRGRIDDFRAWLVAKRAMEYEARGKSTGINTADSRAVAAMFDKDPAFNEAAKRLAVWQDKLLQYSVDSGLISPESAKAMRAASAFYVPMHRIVEIGAGETGAQSSTGMGRGFKPGKPGSYQRVTGGEADIIDPLETMAKNAHVIVSAAEKNAINIALADLGARKDMGKWIQRVPAPKEKVLVDIEKIRKELVANGADLTGVPDDVVLTLWRDSRQAPFGENIIMVNRGGTREFYQVDSEIFKLFHALDAESSGLLLRYLAQPGQLLRSGVTLTPGFSTANAIRDTVSAAVISRYTVFPFEATLRGLGAMIRNPKMVSEWAASGGKQSVEASYFDRDALQRFLRERITKDLSPAEQALIVAKSPLTALRWFTGTLEEATRIGEYQVVLNKLLKQGMDIGEARRQAAYEARDLQDFAKGGAKTKVIRTLTPFWNASLQGNIRLAQAFKEKPLATMLKGLAFITIPKMIEQAINWQDPDYWDRPQWERDLFFMLPIGRDENGRTRFARIPTPFEAGVIFGTIPGRILQHAAKNDPEAFRDLSSTILKSTVSNPIPQSLVTLGEVMAGKQGYSFWRGRPIVPESLKEEAPELRTTAQDSLAAKNLGEMLGIAPAKVEYTIQGLAGGLGKGATHNIIDPIIASITGQQRTAESKNLMGRFVALPAGSQSESVERFYGLLEKARIDASKAKAGMQAGGYASLVTPLERMAKQMSELRKLARTAPTQAEKQRYQLRIADLSRQGLKLESQVRK